jgi:sulfhydrogenase subunit beta (sulfur reductase)
MGKYFISGKNWQKLLQSLARSSSLFYPQAVDEDYHLVRARGEVFPEVPFNRYRCVQSFKSLLFEARLDVGGYFGEGEKERGAERERVVVGAKGCDIHALTVLDFVFKGDVEDPFYLRNRERTLIISSDCTSYKDVCFCVLVGGSPYPEGGYDLNLSPVTGGFVIDVGSPRGEKLIEQYRNDLVDVSEKQLEEVNASRKMITEQLKRHQKELGYLWGDTAKELLERTYESGVWKEEADRCVECGACNFVCPTCHCFLLSDHGREKFTRVRNWDSCQYKGFARVGGGANPRRDLYQRLRNRYEKKFDFCKTVIGVCGCTGCGRCVEACIGKIDMREVLKRLSGCT